MKLAFSTLATYLLLCCLSVSAMAEETELPRQTLITNVNIFNGTDENLARGMSVLVEDNKIAKIAKSIPKLERMTVIDGDGRTLTPGFIDAHTHIAWNLGVNQHMYEPLDYQFALNLTEAENTLMRGFTTIRDIGGQVLGTKKAIDEGCFPGPRIYSPGAAIGMTTGHGDFRTPSSLPRMMGGPGETELERIGITIFADGVPEVLTASRMQFRNGAHFLKIFVGG